MKALTSNEQSILEALADGTFYSVPELYALGRLPADRSAQGVHETAARLAHKGLLEKSRHHNRVFLQITAAGIAALGAESPEFAVARGYTITLLPMRDVDQAVLAALESLWAKTQAETEGVPDVVFSLATGRSSTCNSVRWDLRPVLEVDVTPDGKKATAAGLLQFVLHQAAHALSYQPGKRLPTGGYYHPAQFRDAAETLGLEAKPDDPVGGAGRGWSETSLARGTRTRYKAEVSALNIALTRWTPAGEPAAPYADRNNLVLTCQCDPPRKMRMSARVAALGPVTCGICEQPFTLAE